MARADFFRAKNSDRNAATKIFQCRDEVGELTIGVAGDVLSEETTSPAFVEDADNVFCKPAVIVGTEPLSSNAVGLAGIARSDAMNDAAPCSSVERGKVRPDRRRSQVARFHARGQCGCGISFPLHETDAAASGFSDVESEVESTDAGAERDGTYSHVIP